MKAFALNGRPVFESSNQHIELRLQNEQMGVATARVVIENPNGHFITTCDVKAALLALADKIPTE